MSDRGWEEIEVGVEEKKKKKETSIFFVFFFQRDSHASYSRCDRFVRSDGILNRHSTRLCGIKVLKRAAETYQRGEMLRLRRPTLTTPTEIAY